MRHTEQTGKREALISIMNATYQEVREIEFAHGLRVGDTDFRPRIEHFHDAVRVLSHQPEHMYYPNTRLSVENLAYDMACLRYIQDRPLAKLAHDAPVPQLRNPPPGIAKLPPAPDSVQEPVGASKAVPPNVKIDLAAHYRSYAVMYAALFAETADMNFQTRQNENDTAVQDMAQVEQMLKKVERGEMKIEQVTEMIQQLENPQLRKQLMTLLQRKAKRSEKYAAMQAMLQNQMNAVDMQTKSMDKAHMNFLSGQMLMYQESKDLVRKLSAQGMGMAGQFLENALSQGAGRGGPGQGM